MRLVSLFSFLLAKLPLSLENSFVKLQGLGDSVPNKPLGLIFLKTLAFSNAQPLRFKCSINLCGQYSKLCTMQKWDQVLYF